MRAPFTPTILIVDDHEDGRNMVAEFFRAHAYTTIAVGEPGTALTRCHEFEPAIVLVDLSLPTLAAACQLIRTIKHVQRRAVPYIVGLNGWGFVEHATQALAAGCSVVMAKPLDLPALLAAVTSGVATSVDDQPQSPGRSPGVYGT